MDVDANDRLRWQGFVEVCNTCDRRAQWPFCQHKTNDSQWYRIIRVRETSRYERCK